MAQPNMTREFAGLEIDVTYVDTNSGYATSSLSRNESQIPYAARENNLLPTPATNNTHNDEAAISCNLTSPPRDTSKLITLTDAMQNSTRM